MAARRPLVAVAGRWKELPLGDTVAWTLISGAPTTLAGYGITDAVNTFGTQTVGGAKTFTSAVVVSASAASAVAALQADNGQLASYQLRTGGLDRWSLRKTSASETGSNAGSNFVILRHDDAGALIDIPLLIDRATGVVTFTFTPTVAGNAMWNAGNDGAGSGLDADLLDGYDTSLSDAVNTVAVRTTSADIFARLFRSTFADQASIGGALAFRNENGTDNYIRFCSDTNAIRNFLGLGTAQTPFFSGVALTGAGAEFGSQVAASPTDLSKHIRLFSTTYGFSITGASLNHVAASAAAHNWYSGATNTANLSSVGDLDISGTKYSGDSKEIVRFSDAWLRLNPNGDFANGIYCGATGTLRTDASIQVGPSGSAFHVNAAGVVTCAGSITAGTTLRGRLVTTTRNAATTLNDTYVDTVVEKSDNASYTYTLAAGVGAQGNAITVINSGTAGNITIARAATVALYQNGVDANLTVGPGSMVTIYRSATANRWIA